MPTGCYWCDKFPLQTLVAFKNISDPYFSTTDLQEGLL